MRVLCEGGHGEKTNGSMGKGSRHWGRDSGVALGLRVWAGRRQCGVPNENGTCVACHVGTGVNAGGGSVSVTLPNGTTYTPGVPQQLTVTIADSAQHAWGFQLTARLSTSSSTQAGTFASLDANTQVICGNTLVDINSELVLRLWCRPELSDEPAAQLHGA
jgi:hypothetical protein